jgi:hypothetical protein
VSEVQASTNAFRKRIGSSVGIASGYGVGTTEGSSSSPASDKNFHFTILSRPALGVHPAF